MMDRAGEWLELSVQVDPEAVDAVVEVLARYGYQGGVVIEEAQRPAGDGLLLEGDPSRPATLRTYLHRDTAAAESAGRIQVALSLLGQLRPIGPLQVRVLCEDDWGNAWKQYYPVLHIGERIVVVPAWRRFRAGPDQVVLRLDPGMAFGTGLHPTTRLCLQALERYLRPGMRVLDLGTGSGILAIAAAKLQSGPILALDKDPVAVESARRNVRRNRQAGRIEVRAGTLQPGQGPFDLILANLLSKVLLETAPLLAAALSPQGLLIASGVLVEQAGEVAATFGRVGLLVLEQPQQDDWVALVARRSQG